jgi:probable HAF family extracellular repeat protein
VVRSALAALVVLVPLAVPAVPAGAASSCAPGVQALPGLGGTYAEAKAMNRRGIVVGTAQDADGDVEAVWWDRARHVRVIETGSGLADSAHDVGADGTVVGIADDLEEGLPRAWYRSPHGTVRFLRTPAGAIGSYASALDRRGAAVGFVVLADESFAAVRWRSPGAAPTMLPRRAGDAESIAFGATGKSTVVGGLAREAGGFVPAVWRRHRAPVVLGTDPGIARDVNGRGQVVGTVAAAGGDLGQAVRWDRGGRPLLLGQLPGGTRSGAHAISPRGRVTGQADDRVGVPHAFVWTGRGPLRTLPTLGGDGSGAGNAVDDRGRVAGWSLSADGVQHAALWRCAFGG